jgi:hypothetical protein
VAFTTEDTEYTEDRNGEGRLTNVDLRLLRCF